MIRQKLLASVVPVRTALTVVLSLSLVIALLAASPVVAEPSPERAFIHPDLLEEVEEVDGDTHDAMRAILVLNESVDVSHVAGDPRAVAEELRSFADATQGDVIGQLRATGGSDYQVLNRLWLLNAMLVEFPASETSLNALAALDGVKRVVPNYEFHVIEPEAGEPQTVDDRTYGIDTIEAHRVWDELGVTGEGVRVATLDTGVDIDHPDLAGKMVTTDASDPHYPGGWMQFDSVGNLVESEPYDSGSHGTHVGGTIHGEDHSGYHIGVAPDTEMMHGLVIPGGEGYFAQLTAGMQWAMDPTDADGDPAGEPADVVNMSLGAHGYIAEMIEPTQNMRDAGIFPAFSIGNVDQFGNCGRQGNDGSGSPGNVYEAIAVGATNENDDVGDFSCGEEVDTGEYWGDDAPDDWPDTYMKPDLSAPGVDTLSAVPGGGHAANSGTSMAAPHVAGTAALMLSAAPDESVDSMQATLEGTSFWDDRHYPDRPDRRFGHGRINAFAAVEEVSTGSGIQGTVSGPDGPIEGATVTAGDHAVDTNEDGEYSLRLEPGDYDMNVTAYAHLPETETGVAVTEDEFTTQDFELELAPHGTVSGQVTSALTGDGIEAATITVEDAPFAAETDDDGNYTIEGVPVGDYTVAATAAGFAASEPQEVSVADGETTTLDFTLDELPPDVGIAGDYQGTLGAFLDDNDYPSSPFEWDDDPADYPVVILNRATDPDENVFLEFLEDAAAAGTGLVFLDTWDNDGNGIELLHEHLANPVERDSAFGTAIDELAYQVTAEHPIVDGFAVEETVPFDTSTDYKDHAWFDEYTGDDVTGIADVTVDDDAIGRGIAAQQNDANRHALLSMHGTSQYVAPTDWADDSGQVFLNAVEWVWPESAEITVDPESMSATVPEGDSTDETLTISNTGNDALEWEIQTAEGAAEFDGHDATATVEPLSGCETPVDIDWLDVDPAAGSTDPGDSAEVTVSFDAAELTAGAYEAVLCVTSNATNASLIGLAATLTVEGDDPDPELESVVVEPDPAPVEVADTIQMTALVFFEGVDEPVDVTQGADWASEDENVATVDDEGQVTGVADGDTDVAATFEDESGAAAVMVSEDDDPPPGDPVELEVSPDESAIGVDGVVQLEATAIYDDDSEQPVTDEAEWVSHDTEVATVDDQGLVAGVAEGTAEVTATFDGLSDSASVTVDAQVAPGPEGLERVSSPPGRIEVAIAASQHRFDDGEASAVVLARADEYPDALAGTTLAAEHDASLLITSSDELVDVVGDELARVLGDDGTVYLTGGTEALDETVQESVDDLGFDTTRLGGQTRFETAGLIASELGERDQALVTTGLDFPDALTAGAAAAANDGVVLLSAGDDPHEVVDEYLDAFDGEQVWAIGGPATRAYPDAEAVMGETRDETAVAVADALFDQPVAFGVARRDDYPDALAGGAHIAGYQGPLLLSYTDDVPEETAGWLVDTSATGGFVYGGTEAISEDAFDELDALAFGDDNNDDG